MKLILAIIILGASMGPFATAEAQSCAGTQTDCSLDPYTRCGTCITTTYSGPNCIGHSTSYPYCAGGAGDGGGGVGGACSGVTTSCSLDPYTHCGTCTTTTYSGPNCIGQSRSYPYCS